jgi:pantoate--beta-alanine ligase
VRRVTTIAQVRAGVADARAAGHRIALVPTMGALHEGHLSLVRLAAEHAGTVVVSIFVNPTQFDRSDDLDAYPRDLEGDEAALAALGEQAPSLVFVPALAEVYPRPGLTTVRVAELTAPMEGASRAGHFDAVATVVTKLFNMVGPDLAVFGRKDVQQLQVIRRMVADLDVPVEIVPGPTVREAGGLALSSRNRRLDAGQRRSALLLSRALSAAVEAARSARAQGLRPRAGVLQEAALATLSTAPEVDVDYVEVVDPDTLAPPDGPRGEATGPDRRTTDGEAAAGSDRLIVAVAASVGPVRLIDNVEVGDPDDEDRLLTAIR